jgi:hypothetical protein
MHKFCPASQFGSHCLVKFGENFFSVLITVTNCLKHIAVIRDRERLVIGIPAKIPDGNVVPVLAYVHSHMILDQTVLLIRINLSLGRFPLRHHTRVGSEVFGYRSRRITYQGSKREHPFIPKRYNVPGAT